MKSKRNLCKWCGHILEEGFDFCNIYCARSYDNKQQELKNKTGNDGKA